MTRDLQLLAARYVLGLPVLGPFKGNRRSVRHPGHTIELSRLATALLEEGSTSPSLAQLAGLLPFEDGKEACRLFEAGLIECGVTVPTRRQAITRVSLAIARDVAAGRLDAGRGGVTIVALYRHYHEAPDPVVDALDRMATYFDPDAGIPPRMSRETFLEEVERRMRRVCEQIADHSSREHLLAVTDGASELAELRSFYLVPQDPLLPRLDRDADRQDLVLLAARFVLGFHARRVDEECLADLRVLRPLRVDDLPRIATEALLKGIESRSFEKLAVSSSCEEASACRLFEAGLRECSVAIPTIREAVDQLTSSLANDVGPRIMAARPAAFEIVRLYGAYVVRPDRAVSALEELEHGLDPDLYKGRRIPQEASEGIGRGMVAVLGEMARHSRVRASYAAGKASREDVEGSERRMHDVCSEVLRRSHAIDRGSTPTGSALDASAKVNKARDEREAGTSSPSLTNPAVLNPRLLRFDLIRGRAIVRRTGVRFAIGERETYLAGSNCSTCEVYVQHLAWPDDQRFAAARRLDAAGLGRGAHLDAGWLDDMGPMIGLMQSGTWHACLADLPIKRINLGHMQESWLFRRYLRPEVRQPGWDDTPEDAREWAGDEGEPGTAHWQGPNIGTAKDPTYTLLMPTQNPTTLHEERIAWFMERMAAGERPWVTAYGTFVASNPGARYAEAFFVLMLLDGHHRTEAYARLGIAARIATLMRLEDWDPRPSERRTAEERLRSFLDELSSRRATPLGGAGGLP